METLPAGPVPSQLGWIPPARPPFSQCGQRVALAGGRESKEDQHSRPKINHGPE